MPISQQSISLNIFIAVLSAYFLLFRKGIFRAIKGRISDGSFEQKLKSTALLLPLKMQTIELVLAPLTLFLGAMEIVHFCMKNFQLDLWCLPFSLVIVVAFTGVFRIAKVKLCGITLVFWRMNTTVMDLHIDTHPGICIVKFLKLYDPLVRLKIIKKPNKREIVQGLLSVTIFLSRSIPEFRRAGISTIVISSPWFLNESVSKRFVEELESGVINNQIQISPWTDSKLSVLSSLCAKQIFSAAFLEKEKLENTIIMPAKQMTITLI